jgi:cell division protein FtsW
VTPVTSTSAAARPATQRPRGRISTWTARFESPVTTYNLLLGTTFVLVVFGLVMVLSASTVMSIQEYHSPFAIFEKQLLYACVGTLALVVAARMPVLAWKRLAVPILVVALGLQTLVFTPLGKSANGNLNWIRLGPLMMQPSEVVKLGLVLVGGLVLSRKHRRLDQLGHVVVPFVLPVSALAVGLVLLGGDLGTVLVLGAIIAAVLYAAGVPARWFTFSFLGFGALAAVMVLVSPNRLGRFDVWLGRDTNPFGQARQPMQGRFALADGGWFGLGLGASREKWQWLPEPHNDFIFAIIGEELGLPGTIVVLVLFAVLTLACYLLVMRTTDVFVRIATAGAMTWIVVQAMVNIGTVIGLLPVIGLPLPLVSSGGSSLVTTMLVLGILLSFARAEPGCAKALRTRPSMLRRSLSVVQSGAARRRSGR